MIWLLIDLFTRLKVNEKSKNFKPVFLDTEKKFSEIFSMTFESRMKGLQHDIIQSSPLIICGTWFL